MIDLTGQIFGRLKVLELTNERRRGYACWKCLCECGETVIVNGSDLRSNSTKSCGCYQREFSSKFRSQANRKTNTFDLDTYDFGVGYTSKDEEFYFDKEDYLKVINWYWSVNSMGYISAWNSPEKKVIYLHRMLFNFPDLEVDHINRIPHDNRKENLRIATRKQNGSNCSLAKNNVTGVSGVRKIVYETGTERFRSKLIHNGIAVLDKSFENFDDAVISRLQAEKEYFGDFAPQRHLFEEYGIAQ